uniref:Holocarboxylase synthetase n=1 Tax=Schistosoma japonicum TaxID=6182 RepID=C1LG79_SCHJA|nr:holocarboxylase synthetase [Schistosoma japonicum]
MINTWSTLSLSKFSERLNILSEKPPSIINHDNLINIYYVYSPGEVLPTHVTSVYQKLLRRVHEIIMPNTALLYPLPRKQFSAESWITSGKLLMVLESSLCGDRTTHSADFQKDFTIVTEYLTNGGRVLLVLNTVGVQNVSHTSLAHYTSLSNNSTNLRENSNSHWKWILKDSVLTGGYLYLNNENDARVELTKNHPSIAVLGTDCLQTEPVHLKNALNLLGISCVDWEYNTCDKQLSSNLSSIHLSYSETLYCFTLNSEKKKIVDFIVNGCSTKECNEEVIYCPTVSDLPFGFNWTDYFLNLHSKHLGKLIVWANSMKSSWDFCKKLFERIPPNSGLLVCSNVQTEGKGRGDNKWITPIGQAAFTFHLTQSTSIDQMFMNCVSCTQHIVALSIILACRHLIAEHLKLLPDDTKFSDISEEFLVDLQYHGPKILIKWPNDIYVIDDNYSCDSDQDVNSKLLQHKIIGKLGGLLVHCRLVDLNHAELLIGKMYIVYFFIVFVKYSNQSIGRSC